MVWTLIPIYKMKLKTGFLYVYLNYCHYLSFITDTQPVSFKNRWKADEFYRGLQKRPAGIFPLKLRQEPVLPDPALATIGTVTPQRGWRIGACKGLVREDWDKVGARSMSG